MKKILKAMKSTENSINCIPNNKLNRQEIKET